MTYASEVAADSPYIWLRAGDASDPLLDSGSGGFDMDAGDFGNVTYNVAGLQSGDANGAVDLGAGESLANSSHDFTSLTPKTSFTFEALVNLSAFDDGCLGGFIADAGLGIDSGGGVFAQVEAPTVFDYVATTPHSISLGATHHLAAVFSGATGNLTMYVDGTAVATVATGASGFAIGSSPAHYCGFLGFNGLLAGVMDEIAWYRSALSAARIAAHATAAGFTPLFISGISPSSGSIAGGTSVIITGASFTGATSVDFGGTPAASFVVDSDTQITAVTPAHSVGAIDVTVTTGSDSFSAGFAFVVSPVDPTSDCIVVEVPDFLADGATADANGIVYTPSLVGGWWDSIPLTSATAEVQPRGETITVAQELGREIALEITAHSPEAGVPLGPILCFTAMETIKAAFRTVFVPSTFRVLDPFADRTLLARRVGPIKQTILGDSAVVQSSIPLLGEDPRRLST